jgi:hypothetical protein
MMWDLLDLGTVTGAQTMRNRAVIDHNAHGTRRDSSVLAGANDALNSSHRDVVRLAHYCIQTAVCSLLGGQTETHLNGIDRRWNCTALCRPTKAKQNGHGSRHLGVVCRCLDRIVASLA